MLDQHKAVPVGESVDVAVPRAERGLEGGQGKGCRACTLVVQRVGIPGALSWCIAFVLRKGGHMLFCSKKHAEKFY